MDWKRCFVGLGMALWSMLVWFVGLLCLLLVSGGEYIGESANHAASAGYLFRSSGVCVGVAVVAALPILTLLRHSKHFLISVAVALFGGLSVVGAILGTSGEFNGYWAFLPAVVASVVVTLCAAGAYEAA